MIRPGMINAHNSSDPPTREFLVLVMLQVRMMAKNGSLVWSGVKVGGLGWIGTKRQISGFTRYCKVDASTSSYKQTSSVSINRELADIAHIRAEAESVSDWMRVVTGLPSGSALQPNMPPGCMCIPSPAVQADLLVWRLE